MPYMLLVKKNHLKQSMMDIFVNQEWKHLVYVNFTNIGIK